MITEEISNEMNLIEKTDFKVESEEFSLMNDKEIGNEMNPIEKADFKVEAEEFFFSKDDQGNYDGVMWIINNYIY